MKKVTSLLVIVLAVLMLLVACGGNKDNGTTEPTKGTTVATTTTENKTTTAGTTTANTTTNAQTTTNAAVTTTGAAVTTTGVVTPPAPQTGAPVVNLDFADLNNLPGGATVVDTVTAVDGVDGGKAAQFGAGYIKVPNSDAINFTVEDEFTIDFWYKLDAAKNTAWENLFSKGLQKGEQTGWYGVWLGTGDGATQGVCWGGDTGNHKIGSIESRDVWHRITVIMKDGKISTYLDGTLVKADIAAKPYVSTTDLFIGANSSDNAASGKFHGAIDNFKIYDYAWNEVYAVAPGVEAEKPATPEPEPPAEPTLEDKIYADIDFLAGGTMVDLKGKLDLDLKGATIETKDVTHNGTTIQLPTLNVTAAGQQAIATFTEFADAAAIDAFWNDADGFSFEAFFVNRAHTSTQGVFCSTESAGLGLALTGAGKPGLCLYVENPNKTTYSYTNPATVLSKTDYTHVVATAVKTDAGVVSAIYVNGVLAAENKATGEQASATIYTGHANYAAYATQFSIGSDVGPNQFKTTDFSVADIKVYSAALTAEEVAAAYAFATSAFTATTTTPAE